MKALTRALLLKGLAPAVGVAILVPACGGDDDDMSGTGGASGTGGNTGAGKCESGTVVPEIGSNHGHTLTVPLADVMAGTDKSYMLTTGNNHTHMLDVTAASFSALKASGMVSGLVTVADSTGHMHAILLTCSD
jgi:hypothetical protein